MWGNMFVLCKWSSDLDQLQCCAVFVDPMCDESVRTSKGEWKTEAYNPQSSPSPPPLCLCGCVREANNAVLQRPSTIVVRGVKGALGKEEGWGYSDSVWPFRPEQGVGRPRRAHRHAISSPLDIILRQGRRWGRRGRRTHRGTFQTEKKEGGGRRKVWAQQQYGPDASHFSSTTMLTAK